MSTLTKLLDMLNQVKEENPELANKALLAAETLKSGLEIEEEVVEEEEYDDSYVEVSKEDTNEYFHLRNKLDKKIYDYGVYMRDHAVKENIMLEKIEEIRERNELLLEDLKEKYRLDNSAEYSIQITDQNDGNLVFVKDWPLLSYRTPR